MNQHTTQIHADAPVAGYYRKRLHKDGPWVPVYISPLRPGDKEMQALVGTGKAGAKPSQVNALDIWTWVAGNPVDKQEARFAFEKGHWPGDIGIGDNSGDLSILDEISDAIEQAHDFLVKTTKIETKVEADKAANYRKLLTDLKSKADTARKEEKAPHLEKCREIDGRYNPIIGNADDVSAGLRKHLTAYLAAEDAKARAAAKAAEDAARAALKASAAPEQAVAVTIEAPKVQVGGQRGSRVGLKSVTVYEIGDAAALFAAVGDHPDVLEAMLKVAKARHKSGVEVPGLVARIEKVAS